MLNPFVDLPAGQPPGDPRSASGTRRIKKVSRRKNLGTPEKPKFF